MDIEAIRARWANVTAGQWEAVTEDEQPHVRTALQRTRAATHEIIAFLPKHVPQFYGAPDELKANTEALASAPTDIESLLARVDVLEGALKGAHLLIMGIGNELSRTDKSNAVLVANALGMILAYIRAHNDEYGLLTLQQTAANALAGQRGGEGAEAMSEQHSDEQRKKLVALQYAYRVELGHTMELVLPISREAMAARAYIKALETDNAEQRRKLAQFIEPM